MAFLIYLFKTYVCLIFFLMLTNGDNPSFYTVLNLFIYCWVQLTHIFLRLFLLFEGIYVAYLRFSFKYSHLQLHSFYRYYLSYIYRLWLVVLLMFSLSSNYLLIFFVVSFWSFNYSTNCWLIFIHVEFFYFCINICAILPVHSNSFSSP